jgi:hypothetical protein
VARVMFVPSTQHAAVSAIAAVAKVTKVFDSRRVEKCSRRAKSAIAELLRAPFGKALAKMSHRRKKRGGAGRGLDAANYLSVPPQGLSVAARRRPTIAPVGA